MFKIGLLLSSVNKRLQNLNPFQMKQGRFIPKLLLLSIWPFCCLKPSVTLRGDHILISFSGIEIAITIWYLHFFLFQFLLPCTSHWSTLGWHWNGKTTEHPSSVRMSFRICKIKVQGQNLYLNNSNIFYSSGLQARTQEKKKQILKCVGPESTVHWSLLCHYLKY